MREVSDLPRAGYDQIISYTNITEKLIFMPISSYERVLSADVRFDFIPIITLLHFLDLSD